MDDDRRLHERIDAMDDKLSKKIDSLAGALGVFDRRLSVTESLQATCLETHREERAARTGASVRVVAGVVVGLILGALSALAAAYR
jgi:F0F1-type ATP synthase assembly protein I